MKILITGANGYIGKSLYSILKNKYKITTITKNECDLTNSSAVNFYFSDKWFDIIIHCAVKGGHRLDPDNYSTMDSNLIMYYNLLNNKSSYGKLIHFGSGAELYAQNTPYGLSKHIIRQSILEKDNFYNLRIFAAFDENEWDTRFIKANIKRYINKEPIIIHQDKYMDFIYMPDLIKIVEYYINNDKLLKEIDCVYNTTYSLTKISQLINELDEYRVEIKIEKEDGSNYKGQGIPLIIDFIGLKQGIKEVYNKLKQ